MALPGIAGKRGIEVQDRIQLYYTAIAGVAFIFIFLYPFANLLGQMMGSAYRRLAGWILIAGILNFINAVFGGYNESFNWLIVLLFLLCTYFFFLSKPLHKLIGRDLSLSYQFVYYGLMAIGFSLWFCDFYFIAFAKEFPVPLSFLLFFLSLPLLDLIQWNEKSKQRLRILLTLISIWPILSVFLHETSIIFSHHFQLDLRWWLFIFLNAIVLLFVIRFRNPVRQMHYLLPLAIFGLALKGYFVFQLSPNPDLFETANPANGMLRSFAFGEWPFLDYLNSHLLSELAPAFLHGMFYGLQNDLSFLRYDFVSQSLKALILFFFISKVSRSNLTAFYLLALFPWTFSIIPEASVWFLPYPLLLLNYFNRNSWKSAFTFSAYLVLLIFWRIDLGAAALYLTPFVLLVSFLFSHLRKSVFRLCLSIIALGILSGFIFLIMQSITSNDLLGRIALALEYFGASQAHGLAMIFGDNGGRLAQLHHFVFPAILVLICFLLIQLSFNKYANGKDFTYPPLFSAIVLAFFCIANAPRGLVRHGFAENSDWGISSFFVLVIILAIQLFMESRKQFITQRNFSLLIAAVILLLAFKFPGPTENKALLGKFTQNPRIPRPYELRSGFDLSSFKAPDSSLIRFLQNDLSDEQTFVDLSNSPLYYYLSGKAVPGYFNQNLQNAVGNKAQKNLIDEIEEKGAAICLMRHKQASWWDRVDGIPNALRYWDLSQYMYSNYEPFGQSDNYVIWKKKDILLPKRHLDSLNNNSDDNYDLGELVFHLDYDKRLKKRIEVLPAPMSGNDFLSLPSDMNGAYALLLLESEHAFIPDNYWKISYFGRDGLLGSFTFESGKGGARKAIIPLSSQENWIVNKVEYLIIEREKEEKVKYIYCSEYED